MAVPVELRPSVAAWCAVAGAVVGWDVAAKVFGVPTLSAGAAAAVGHRRARWVVWVAGGVLAHHLIVPQRHKLRVRRRGFSLIELAVAAVLAAAVAAAICAAGSKLLDSPPRPVDACVAVSVLDGPPPDTCGG